MAVNAANNEAGFTLVEILCVLALLGLTAGLVVMNLPQGDDPFETRMERLATQFNIVQRDSTIDGRMRGLEINGDGFDLYSYDSEWRPLSDQDWGDVFKVELKVEDQTIDFKERAKILAADEDEIATPLIRFDPTEGVTDFELEIQGPNRTFLLSLDERGRVTAEPIL